jgi:hypothetical protein
VDAVIGVSVDPDSVSRVGAAIGVPREMPVRVICAEATLPVSRASMPAVARVGSRVSCSNAAAGDMSTSG